MVSSVSLSGLMVHFYTQLFCAYAINMTVGSFSQEEIQLCKYNHQLNERNLDKTNNANKRQRHLWRIRSNMLILLDQIKPTLPNCRVNSHEDDIVTAVSRIIIWLNLYKTDNAAVISYNNIIW